MADQNDSATIYKFRADFGLAVMLFPGQSGLDFKLQLIVHELHSIEESAISDQFEFSL